ncbi:MULTISPECIES: hypothetical protein [Actinomycetes]|uniref:hypothetical protein n=1 Tax=Actinomycetes TaxID=1760 RepID=UPI00068FE9E1|nr:MULTISPECIES: hypothetical protein [Actinomycetes]
MPLPSAEGVYPGAIVYLTSPVDGSEKYVIAQTIALQRANKLVLPVPHTTKTGHPMNKYLAKTATVAVFASAGLALGAGTAGANPVDVPKPPTPPWSESADGLTYCYEGFCDNWDKLSNYVCTTGAPTALICDGIMLGVRLLPPLNIGDLVPHNLIP